MMMMMRSHVTHHLIIIMMLLLTVGTRLSFLVLRPCRPCRITQTLLGLNTPKRAKSVECPGECSQISSRSRPLRRKDGFY
jgi:hypothetical protein